MKTTIKNPIDPERNASIYQAAEQLSDLICEQGNTSSALSAGLKFVLNYLNRPGGVLFVKPSVDAAPLFWISSQVPETWKAQLSHSDGFLHQVATQIIHSGEPAPADLAHALAGGIPIQVSRGCLGALIVNDPTCAPLDLPALEILMRPIARCILQEHTHLAAQKNSKELAALQLIASAQNIHQNIEEIQLGILKAIKDILDSDIAILALVEGEQDGLITEKVLGSQENWLEQTVLKLESGPIQECIQKGNNLVVEDFTSSPEFDPLQYGFDPSEIHFLFCVPLIANGDRLGAIEAFSKMELPISPYDEGLIMSMATSLANTMFTIRLIRQLKIANADLEASQWDLLHSRNTLRALFDSIPASIYIIDLKYNLVAINMSRSDRANSKPNLLVGKKCYEALYQRGDPCPGCQVGETLFTGVSTVRTQRTWISNDQPMEWEVSTYPIQDNVHQSIQAILLEQDVTEKRRLEASLAQSEKLAAVGQLAAGVAHEINNPLAAIIANAQLLGRALPQDDDLQESVKLIELAGGRATQVVRNLLNFARKEQYEFTLTDLNETIRNGMALLQHEFIARPVELKFDLVENLPPLLASRDHLQGVWINLVLNALDAIETEKGEISIATRAQGNELRVIIADNGKGIPPEQVSRIFEPFYTTKSPGKAGRGTGLGLSVCHRIVKQHGGQILVDSQVGVGTKFTVILPAKQG